MVSSLMLLTQRITSVSMDFEERKVILHPKIKGRDYISHLLPYTCYSLSFVSLLGGPLCPYNQFVSFVHNIEQNPPPSPIRRVSLRLLWVFILEVIKYLLICFLQMNSVKINNFSGLLWIWNLSLALKITYYSHWALSECLNNASGLGFSGNRQTGFQSWSGLSDGELWTTETSCRLSEFTRQWNSTTAAWLRRLIYQRCKTFPLGLTFGFSALWHGLHPRHVIGFFVWGVNVKIDYQLHNYLSPRLTSSWIRKVFRCLGWIQTQMVMACVVITIELGHVNSVSKFSFLSIYNLFT